MWYADVMGNRLTRKADSRLTQLLHQVVGVFSILQKGRLRYQEVKGAVP